MMNRRALLRLAAIVPVALVGAKLGIDAAPAQSTGVLRLPNDAALAARNAVALRDAGLVSVETVMGSFNMPDGMRKHYMATLLERTKVLDYTIFDKREDMPFVLMPRVSRWKQIP